MSDSRSPDEVAASPASANRQQPPRLTRRRLLQSGLTAGAVLGAGAWTWPADALDRTRHHTPPLRSPGSLPYPDLPEGTDTIPQVEHIVVLMMENHSYDNKLGMLRRPDADGFKLHHDRPVAVNPYPNGDLQHAFHMPTTCQLSGKPSQEWVASHMQFDNGRNDGFVSSPSGPVSMGYWDGPDQPFYYSLASVFPVADRYFSSVLGQTFPNRRYLISATSIGQVDDTIPQITDYPANGTIFDRLDAVGVTWRDYYTTLPTVELYPQLFFKNQGTKAVTIDHFFTDVAAGNLPGFCLVEPDYGNQSEEDPQNVAQGEQFAAKVINAVMAGPGWERTLLIWTYDEHGGYYDHVPPPPALAPDTIPPAVPPEIAFNGFAQYGFRVPCVVVSPWARQYHVSHQTYDHTSICALVEAKWNLPAMTFRDANANPMLGMLNLHHPAFLSPPALAPPLLTTDPSALACNVSGPGTIPPPGSVTPPEKAKASPATA
ncbi:MAG: alkaline phosphatase family protein [Acidimicrobiaceae bacterium]|nr:alkaline phosphatase family protein [Acidimicrobiaceae bacterium]